MRPDDVRTREDLARALTEIRSAAGLSIRETAARAGALTPTVGGWFSGQHAPTASSEPVLRKVLAACGVEGPEEQAPWIAAAERARRPGGRRAASTPTPYLGFAAFGVEDHDWFFGREDITDLVIGTVLEQADHPTATMPGVKNLSSPSTYCPRRKARTACGPIWGIPGTPAARACARSIRASSRFPVFLPGTAPP